MGVWPWLDRHARAVLAGYWVLLAAGTHWPNLSLIDPPEDPGPFQHVLKFDKVLHAAGFGGLMVLLILAGLGGRHRPWARRCGVALGIGLVYAALDELTQGLMRGRTVNAADLITNLIVVLGVYLLAMLPSEREPTRPPRALGWALALSLPVLAVLALSPWVMARLIEWKNGALDMGPVVLQPWDHIGHGVLAGAISVVVIAVWPMASRRPRRAAAVALLVLLLSAPGLEVAQHFTGRGVEWQDVLAHAIGVLLAMMWWAARLAWSPSMREAEVEAGDGLKAEAGAETEAVPPRFVGHALLVGALTLLSRFAGLARDAVLAAALGLSVAADAFFIGFLVPNLFRRLFGEGALSAAFIPHYTALLERDPALAKRFASLTLTLLSVLLVGITLVAEGALWLIAARLDEGHKASLAIYYTRLMLPYMPLICAVALVGGVLQVHKRFGPPAAAPLVLNGVIVAAVLMATGLFANDTDARVVATWVAVGVVIAGVLQLAWQTAVLLRVTGLTRSFAGSWPTMKAMLIMMGPMVIGLAVFQINALLDALIAFFFAPPPEFGAGAGGRLSFFGFVFDAPLRNGDVAALNWSQRLYQFPLGVFGIAIATAIFPALSAAAAKTSSDNADRERPKTLPGAASSEFAAIVRQGLRLTVFIGLPASVGLILVRVPLARTVFEHGGFTTDDALRVSVILAGYAASVWAYSMTHTLTRAFYALKDATTPLKISACMVLLNLTLNLSLIWALGAAGLAWSTAISAAGQAALLLLFLRRRVPGPIDAAVAASWRRTALGSVVMAGVLLPIVLLARPAELSWWESAGLLIALVALGAAVVLGVAWLSKAEELNWLRKRSIK